MNRYQLYDKAQSFDFLTLEEGLFLYQTAPVSELMQIAHQIRKKRIPENQVTWMIDRNVNITNVCISLCKFCNFCRVAKDSDSYITTLEEYRVKIKEMLQLGGDQLLLQGGMHPKLGITFYEELYRNLKKEFPNVKLHTLGPPEIHYLANKDNLTYKEVLQRLQEAGLDSLPGAGAEILSDRVRKIVSPAKCTVNQWLDVMREAHKMNIPTSATMMFGHIETVEERIQHLIHIRQVQSEKPKLAYGFIAFISWPFQAEHTVMKNKMGVAGSFTLEDYLRMVAISRIMLPNIINIQASWLTVGKAAAQIALHGGANDMGSIMIEENVVSAAGATNAFDAKGIQNAIVEAGFEPIRRDQIYNLL